MMNRFSRLLFWITSAASFCFVFGQDGAKAPSSPMSGGMGSLLPMMVVMIAVVYFFMIRPEQKKQKERQSMLHAIKKGDRVLTSAGILGTVGSIKDNTMMIKIAENTIVEFSKSSVTGVVNKDGTEKQADSTDEEKK